MEGDRQVDQVRGGRGGGGQQVVETPRGHALPALPLRVEEPAAERYRHTGHGGYLHRANRRLGIRQYDQQQQPAVRQEGQGEGGAAEETQAPAPEEEPRAAFHQVVQ